MASCPIRPCSPYSHGIYDRRISRWGRTSVNEPEEKRPHDSARIYSSQKKKHWYDVGAKIAQSEQREKSRGQWILLAMLVIFAVAGGSFLGFILEVQVFNPPAQVTGVCPPPAYVSGYDCLQRVCSTPSGQTAQTCTVVPAGYIFNGG